MNAESPSALNVPATWPNARYVVGVDGSECSKTALRYALRLADLTGASVEALIAWRYPPTYGPAYTPMEWAAGDDAVEILRDSIDATVGPERPANLSAVAQEGITAQVLIERSGGADLLVVGSRGHGGFAGLLLGSVSSACAEHAHCPVLVVHQDHRPLQR